MASFVDSTVKDIDDRVRELQSEISKLQAARSALVGTRRRPGRPAGSTTRTRRRTNRGPGRPRGRRRGTTRATQALDLVRDQPGITIPQIAGALKIEPNYLYRVMPKLIADRQVRRQGQGWYPLSQG